MNSSHVPEGTTAVLLTYYCNQTQLMVSETGSSLTTANNPSGGDGASPRSQGQACTARNNSIDMSSGWVSVSSDRSIRYAFAGLDGQTGTGQIRLDGYMTE